MSSDPEELSDQDVVRLVQQGEADAFGRLIERYGDRIKRYVSRFFSSKDDVDDIVQETFIKAYRNIKQFNPQRPWSPWLYRIAHNQLVNALKKKKKDPLFFFDLDVYLPRLFSVRDTEAEISRRETKRLVEDSLAQLDFKYREVLILYYLEGLSYQEIAEVMRVPVSTVGIRLKRARHLARQIYQQRHGTID